jgi:hypothetical protein
LLVFVEFDASHDAGPRSSSMMKAGAVAFALLVSVVVEPEERAALVNHRCSSSCELWLLGPES